MVKERIKVFRLLIISLIGWMRRGRLFINSRPEKFYEKHFFLEISRGLSLFLTCILLDQEDRLLDVGAQETWLLQSVK